MRTALCIALIFAVPAQAQSLLGSSTPRQVLLPATEGASVEKANSFLIGLGLVGAGLVLGGAGFAVLYVCREGQDCHQDKTLQYVGWGLAAPGIIPLAIGLLLLYGATGGRSGGSHGASAVSVGLMPLPGGGAFASGAFTF